MRKFIERWTKSLGTRRADTEFTDQEKQWMKEHEILAILADEANLHYFRTEGVLHDETYLNESDFLLDHEGKICEVDPWHPDGNDPSATNIGFRILEFRPWHCECPYCTFDRCREDEELEFDVHASKGLIIDMQDIRMKGFKLSETEEDQLEKILEKWDYVLDESGKGALYYGLRQMSKEEIERDFVEEINERSEFVAKSKWPVSAYAEVIGNIFEDRNRHAWTNVGQKVLSAASGLDEHHSQRYLMIRLLIEFFG